MDLVAQTSEAHMQEQRQVRRAKTYLAAEIWIKSGSGHNQLHHTKSVCTWSIASDRERFSYSEQICHLHPTQRAILPRQIVWQQLGRAGLVFENSIDQRREGAVHIF
jgi:hypothetical protein